MVDKSIYIESTDFINFSIFQKSIFDEKSISWDGIWIAGRPQSRRDPPRPQKNKENIKKPKKQICPKKCPSTTVSAET